MIASFRISYERCRGKVRFSFQVFTRIIRALSFVAWILRRARADTVRYQDLSQFKYSVTGHNICWFDSKILKSGKMEQTGLFIILMMEQKAYIKCKKGPRLPNHFIALWQKKKTWFKKWGTRAGFQKRKKHAMLCFREGRLYSKGLVSWVLNGSKSDSDGLRARAACPGCRAAPRVKEFNLSLWYRHGWIGRQRISNI